MFKLLFLKSFIKSQVSFVRKELVLDLGLQLASWLPWVCQRWLVSCGVKFLVSLNSRFLLKLILLCVLLLHPFLEKNSGLFLLVLKILTESVIEVRWWFLGDLWFSGHLWVLYVWSPVPQVFEVRRFFLLKLLFKMNFFLSLSNTFCVSIIWPLSIVLNFIQRRLRHAHCMRYFCLLSFHMHTLLRVSFILKMLWRLSHVDWWIFGICVWHVRLEVRVTLRRMPILLVDSVLRD